jgi:hypothetical protein
MQPNLPHKVNISVRMPRRLRDELRREAAVEEMPLGEYIRVILIARQKPSGGAA